MSRATGFALALGFVAALGLSCLGPLPVDEYTYSCTGDGDCSGPHLCVRGVCRVPGDCTVADDCGAGNCCDTFAGANSCVRAGQDCSFGSCNAQARACQ